METNATSTTAASSERPTSSPTEPDRSPALVRILKNPLFLVIFTWVLMAFLLAFEVSGK